MKHQRMGVSAGVAAAALGLALTGCTTSADPNRSAGDPEPQPAAQAEWEGLNPPLGWVRYGCKDELETYRPSARIEVPGSFRATPITCMSITNRQGLLFSAPGALGKLLTSSKPEIESRASSGSEIAMFVNGGAFVTDHGTYSYFFGNNDQDDTYNCDLGVPGCIFDPKLLKPKLDFALTGDNPLAGEHIVFEFAEDKEDQRCDREKTSEYIYCDVQQPQTQMASWSATNSFAFGVWPVSLNIVNYTDETLKRVIVSAPTNMKLDPIAASENIESIEPGKSAAVGGYRTDEGNSSYDVTYLLEGTGDLNGVEVTINPILAAGDNIIPDNIPDPGPDPTESPDPDPTEPPEPDPDDPASWCSVITSSSQTMECNVQITGGILKTITFTLLPFKN